MTNKLINLSLNDELFSVKFLDAREKGFDIKISQDEFFKYTAAKHINITSFKFSHYFFSGIDINGNQIDFSPYKGKELSYVEMVEIIYGANQDMLEKARSGNLALFHYTTDTKSKNYASNSLVFGSSNIQIDRENIRFYINYQGIPNEIRNVKFNALNDNFDYESKNVNPALNLIVKTFIKDKHSKKTHITFEDDRPNYYYSVSRDEFETISKNSLKINSEDRDYIKLFKEGKKINNHRWDVHLGFNGHTTLKRKKNLLDLYNSVSDNKIYDEKQTNNWLDITSNKSTLLIENPDFILPTKGKQIAINEYELNRSTRHKDLGSTAIVTDDTRIANHNLIRNEAIDIKPYEFNKNRPSLYYHSTKLVNAQGRPYKIANDPLVLDLNGNGVQVVSYNEKPVLFDIDNDGGSLEETGWVDARDGLLVRDLNGNGKIDNMSEVFSEYYAGRAGASGEEGEKRFKHGFKALSTKLPFFLPSHLM